jgi:hypothetical protein
LNGSIFIKKAIGGKSTWEIRQIAENGLIKRIEERILNLFKVEKRT